MSVQVRFTPPTPDMPFFTNVKLKTRSGWQKMVSLGPLGWQPAMFPNEREMMENARKVSRHLWPRG